MLFPNFSLKVSKTKVGTFQKVVHFWLTIWRQMMIYFGVSTINTKTFYVRFNLDSTLVK